MSDKRWVITMGGQVASSTGTAVLDPGNPIQHLDVWGRHEGSSMEEMNAVESRGAHREIHASSSDPPNPKLGGRSIPERQGELLSLHDTLNTASRGSIGRSAAWFTLYRRILVLPSPLEAALVTLEMLGYLENDGGKGQMEELIIQGEDSQIFGEIHEIWRSLGEGADAPVTWGERRESFSSLAFYDGSPLAGLKMPASIPQVMEHFTSLKAQLGAGHLYRELRYVLDSMEATYVSPPAVYREFYELVRDDHTRRFGGTSADFMNSPLAPIFLAMGTITVEKMERFFSTAEEYNLEWALAAFEWGDGEGATTPLERIQVIVNETPWSE